MTCARRFSARRAHRAGIAGMQQILTAVGLTDHSSPAGPPRRTHSRGTTRTTGAAKPHQFPRQSPRSPPVGDICQAVRARLRPRIRWLKPASGFRHNPNKPVTDSMAPIAGVNTHRTDRQPASPAASAHNIGLTHASASTRTDEFPAGATPTFAMPTSATPSLTGTALLNTAEHPDPCSDALQGSRNATVPASLVTTGCLVSQLRDVLVPLSRCEASRSCTDPFDGVMDV